MVVEPASWAAVEHVLSEVQQQGLAEMLAVGWADDLAGVMSNTRARFTASSEEYMVFGLAEPIAVARFTLARPGVLAMGFFATDELPAIIVPLTRFARKTLFPNYHDAGIHRIECSSLQANTEAHRWMRMLGMVQEGCAVCAGRNGENFLQFARIAPDVIKKSSAGKSRDSGTRAVGSAGSSATT